MASTSLFFDIFGRDHGVGDMLDGTAGKASKMGGVFGGVAGMAAKMVAPLAALAGAGAVARFANESVDSFAGFEDAAAAAGVIFGDSMGKITAQADTAAAKMGLSKTQVIDAANTFGTFGKSAGLAGDDLAGFSVDMTQLAGDMASFKGKTPEEAIMAIGSALRGESEPIRQFGVLLDDATLRNRALSMGLISTTKDALTPQQKVLAAQKEILAQTSDAQGDFARTSDSTANTQKRLAAATEDLHVKVGSFLAPAFTMARESALNFINGASGVIDKLGPGFAQFLSGIGPLVQGMFQLAGSVSPVHIILTALAPFIPQLVAAFMQLASAIGGMLPPILAALQPLFGAVVQVIQMLIAAIMPLIPVVLQIVASVIPPLIAILTAVIPTVQMLIQTAIIPLIQFLGTMLPPVINALLPVVQIVFNTIAAVITNVMQIIQGIIQVVTGIISGNWSQVWQGIQNITGGVFGAINSLISGALGVIRAIVNNALSAIGSFFSSTWSNVLSGIGGFVSGAVGWFQRLPGMILGALAGASGWLLNVGRDIIAGLARGISGAANMIFDAVRGAVGNVVDFAKRILGIGSPSKVMDEEVGQWIPPGVAQGIRRAIPKVVSAMGSLSSVVRNGVDAANLDLTLSGSGVGGFTRSGGSAAVALLDRRSADSKMDELIDAIKGQRPIQVNPSEKMSEQNLARILAEQIMWRKK